MSRLKGADLGVSVPAGTLNFRGPWSAAPSPAYAASDVVLRFGIPYIAVGIPGAIDPVGGSAALGAVASSGALSYWGQQSAQAFTVSKAVTVAAVTLTAGTGGGNMTSGTVSITPDYTIGTNPLPTALASVATGALTSGSSATYTFPTPVTLLPGVTYRLVVTDPNVASKPSASASISGLIASYGNVLAGSGGSIPNANIVTTGITPFSLVGNPWQSMDPASAMMNFVGGYDSSKSYNPNDVVKANNLLWLAVNAAPAGSTPTSSYGTVTTAAANASVQAGYDKGITTVRANNGSYAHYTQFTLSQTISFNCIAVSIATGGVTDAYGLDVGICATAPTTSSGGGANPWLTQGGQSVMGHIAQGAAAGENVVVMPGLITLPPGTYYLLTNANPNSGASFDPSNLDATTGGTVVGPITLVAAATAGTSSRAGYTADNTKGHSFYLSNTSTAVNPWTPLTSPQENVNIANSGSAVTLPDVTVATMHKITLNAATPAITLPAPGQGKSFTVELVQDATGGRVPSWATPSGVIRWPGGTAPTITATANAIDVITFICVGGTNWYGFVAGQAFA